MPQNSPPQPPDNCTLPIAPGADVAVNPLVWRSDMSAKMQVACIRDLAKMDSEQATEALQQYLRPDTPPDVLDELTNFLSPDHVALTVNVLTIPSVLSGLQKNPSKWAHYRPYIRDLTPLAGLSGVRSLYLDKTQITDFTPLASLRGLQKLGLNDTRIKDLTPLAGLSGLEWLWLSDTLVSDLTPLAGLHNLQILYLHNTRITDLKPLAGLNRLDWLCLSKTQVSDLTPLEGMSKLRVLFLRNTQVSDQEMKRFRALLRLRKQKISWW